MVSLRILIEEIVEQELDEVNSIGAGNVSATGNGSALGGDMSPAHRKMWSGDKPKLGNKLGENVLDKMGLQKATSNVRRGALSGEVYMDRHDNDKENTKKVMAKVAKNLNKKPYSKSPPMMGLREGVEWLIESARLLAEAKIDVAIQTEQDPEIKEFLEFVKAENLSPKFLPWLIKHARKEKEQWHGMGPAQADVANMAIGLRKFEALAGANRIQKKDINAYSSFQELWQTVNALENAPSATALKKAAKSETEVFYSDSEYLILEPQSMASACHYGQGTKWCISATQAQNYFDSYTRDGAKFLFVINKKTGDKTAIAHTEAGIEIYDAADDRQSEAYISEIYPPNIVLVLNQIWEKKYGFQPFVDYNINEILANPEPLIYDSRLQERFWQEPISIQVRMFQAMGQQAASGAINNDGEYFQMIMKKIAHRAMIAAPGMYAGKLWATIQTDPQRLLFGLRGALASEIRTFVLAKEHQKQPVIIFPLVIMANVMKNVVGALKTSPGTDPTTTLIQIIANQFIAKYEDYDYEDPFYQRSVLYWQNANSAKINDIDVRAAVVDAVTWAEELGWNFFPAQ